MVPAHGILKLGGEKRSTNEHIHHRCPVNPAKTATCFQFEEGKSPESKVEMMRQEPPLRNGADMQIQSKLAVVLWTFDP